MSDLRPNYCGPHDQHYNHNCTECVMEWIASLSHVERALIEYRGNRTPRECQFLIDAFRKMELGE